MMSDVDFVLKLCDRMHQVLEEHLAATCAVIRADAECECARAELRTANRQIENAKLREAIIAKRDSLKEKSEEVPQ